MQEIGKGNRQMLLRKESKTHQGKHTSKRPSKKTEQFSSFGAAFRDARKRLGTGKTFTYKGKKYSTVTKAELKGMNLREDLNKLRSKKKGK